MNLIEVLVPQSLILRKFKMEKKYTYAEEACSIEGSDEPLREKFSLLAGVAGRVIDEWHSMPHIYGKGGREINKRFFELQGFREEYKELLDANGDPLGREIERELIDYMEDISDTIKTLQNELEKGAQYAN